MQEELKKNEEYEETMDFSKADYTFVPKGIHEYKQEGYYLVCRSCDLHHAVHIGPEKVMVGKDKKGTPLFKKRKEVGLS